MSQLLTTKEAGRLLKITPTRVRQLIASGRLNAVKHGRDHLLDAEAVDRFNREGRKPPGRPAKNAAQ